MGSRGSYQTPNKNAIIHYFMMHPEACIGADELCALLNREGAKMGITTIYRTLGCLCSQNILRRYVREGHASALYQYNQCGNEHLHIRCERCGALAHLHCDEVESFCSHLLTEHGFVMDESKTMLYGLCNQCSKELAHEK